MKGCLKLVIVPIGLILIAGAVCSLLLFTRADSYLRDSLVGALQYATHADLRVDRVQLRPLQRALVISNLRINNPAAFKSGEALKIAKVTMEFDPKTVFSNTPVIRKLSIEGADVALRYETGVGSNLRKLIDVAANLAAQRRFKIDEMRCEQGKVHLTTNMPLPPVEMNLPAFTLNNLGDKPMGMADATALFLKTVLRETLTLKGMLNPVAEKLKAEAM